MLITRISYKYTSDITGVSFVNSKQWLQVMFTYVSKLPLSSTIYSFDFSRVNPPKTDKWISVLWLVISDIRITL